MASIRKGIVIEAPAETVWAAVRDVGAVHERLAPGFVVDTRLEDGARDGERRSRVVWIADLLPNELAGHITGMIEQGMTAMKKTLES
jgi:hypothetical protein